MSRHAPPGLVDGVPYRCTAWRRVLVGGHYDKRPGRSQCTNLRNGEACPDRVRIRFGAFLFR